MTNIPESPPGSALGEPRLVEAIRAEIAATGRIPFARFMELALLHPQYGYYVVRPGIGRAGDFVTAPELHAAFGACVARQAAEIWHRLKEPEPFTLLEWGAGTGVLARDIIRALQADSHLAAALDYAIREPSPALTAVQRETLGAPSGPVRWTTAAAPAVGMVLANEVLDALPVHRLTLRDGQVREIYVGWHDGSFREELGPLSRPELARHLAEHDIDLAEAQVAEINLAALAWLDQVAAALERGAIVIIDYGDTTAELYSARRIRGTLMCYWRHQASEDPYHQVGWQDMTAHVDFGALMRRAEQLGLTVAGLTTQGAFLASLDIGDELLALQQHVAPVDYVRQRQLIADLIRPDRLGRFKVLILTRQLPESHRLRGFRIRL